MIEDTTKKQYSLIPFDSRDTFDHFDSAVNEAKLRIGFGEGKRWHIVEIVGEVSLPDPVLIIKKHE